jgi:tetratricopeptide (TPR) repeat protein
MNNPLSTCLTTGILFFVALSASATPAQEATTGKTQQTKPLPISKEARTALKEAKAVAAKSKGLKGEARSNALIAGAKAYEAVAARFDSEAGACGNAWFAAAELWRRSSSLEAAAKAYGLAADRDPARYQERSWLQLAHIARRQKKDERALDLYKKVARLKSGTARTHQARVWIGRCFEQQKKPEQAIDAYRQALSLTTKPRRVLEISNRLANCLIKQGKLDQAGAVIRQAEAAAAPELAKKGPRAKSLRRALDRMSARKALQRARDKTAGAHQDAQDVERGR